MEHGVLPLLMPNEPQQMNGLPSLRGRGRTYSLTLTLLGCSIFCWNILGFFCFEIDESFSNSDFRTHSAPLAPSSNRPAKAARGQDRRYWVSGTQIALLVTLAFSTAAGVTFLGWIYQVAGNLAILQAEKPDCDPTTSLILSFVPLGNFYWSYSFVQEIWRATDPRAIQTPVSWKDVPESWIILLCWYLHPIGLVLSVVPPLGVYGCACLAVSGGLLMQTVMRIARHQRERYIRLYEEPA